MNLRRGLARSLRLIRKAKGVTQDDLSEVSGRTYLSEIERGLKNPTVEKIDELARAMGVHPLTVLVLAYLASLREQELAVLQERVRKEVTVLLTNVDVGSPKKAR